MRTEQCRRKSLSEVSTEAVVAGVVASHRHHHHVALVPQDQRRGLRGVMKTRQRTGRMCVAAAASAARCRS